MSSASTSIPPDKALVLCVDEKSQIQALERTQRSLPLNCGTPETRTPPLPALRHDDAVRGLGCRHGQGHR